MNVERWRRTIYAKGEGARFDSFFLDVVEYVLKRREVEKRDERKEGCDES